MKLLIPSFPREAACPRRRLFFDKKEFLQFINRHNKINNLYYSLYQPDFPMTKPNFINPVIDKVFFDLDSSEAFINLKKMHYKLNELNLKHLMIFSGRNYQLYVFCNSSELINGKNALFNAHNFISEKCEMIWGDEKVCDLDHHVRGDIARIVRVPNTVNLRTKLYCIPLRMKDIIQGEDFIKEKAKRQCFDFKTYGSELLDLEQFDNEVVNNCLIENVDYEDSGKEIDELIKDFPLCVKDWLINPVKAKLRQRYFFTLFCRCLELSRRDCDRIAFRYWGRVKDSSGRKSKYKEFIEERHIKCVYGRDCCFPSCWRLEKEGLCPGKCSLYNVWNGSS